MFDFAELSMFERAALLVVPLIAAYIVIKAVRPLRDTDNSGVGYGGGNAQISNREPGSHISSSYSSGISFGGTGGGGDAGGGDSGGC